MEHIVNQILADRARQRVTFEELANRMHRDTSTVQNQLCAKNPRNLTYLTLQEYARALGGDIVYISEGVKRHLENDGIPRMQQRFAELGTQLEHLKERLNEKDERIRSMQGGLDLREQQLLLKDSKISILRDDIQRKERIISAKSDLIEEQYRQIIALQQQIIEMKYTKNSYKVCRASYVEEAIENADHGIMR